MKNGCVYKKIIKSIYIYIYIFIPGAGGGGAEGPAKKKKNERAKEHVSNSGQTERVL